MKYWMVRMTDDRPRYDIAISFLSSDLELAEEIASNLSSEFEVFIYTERQDQVAFSDGFASFRNTYRRDSRFVLVLFRDGWGDEGWTWVESTAIKDRILREQTGCLLFVSLDDSTRPWWVPDTYIRFDHGEYGTSQLLSSIKERMKEGRSENCRSTTVTERVAQIVGEEQRRTRQAQMLRDHGFPAAKDEILVLFHMVLEKVNQIDLENRGFLRGEFRGNTEGVLRTDSASLRIRVLLARPEGHPKVVVREYVGPTLLPSEEGRYGFDRAPEHQRDHEYEFFYTEELWWCWRDLANEGRLLPTEELSEEILNILLDLHESVASGEIQRRGTSEDDL